jgi:hypothetical protein
MEASKVTHYINHRDTNPSQEDIMNRRNILNLSAITAMGLAMLPGTALSQQKTLKEQLIGTWIVVSADSTAPDGKKEQLYGPNPKGILVLDQRRLRADV